MTLTRLALLLALTGAAIYSAGTLSWRRRWTGLAAAMIVAAGVLFFIEVLRADFEAGIVAVAD